MFQFHQMFNYILQKLSKMSFYFIVQPPCTNFLQNTPFYYISTQFQQPAPNLLMINQYTPSQSDLKQYSIIQTLAPTRQSLQEENIEKSKNPRKKKSIKRVNDQNFGWRNQNKDRNLMSNILKAFVHYLSDQEGMKVYLQELHNKFNLKNGVSAFYDFVQLKFPLAKSYISPKQFVNLIKDPAEPEPMKLLLRLAIARFLKLDFSLILLKSSKIKKRSKLQHMKKSRELFLSMFRV